MKMKFSSSGEGRENRFEAGGIFRWGRRRRHLTHLMHKEEGERLMKVPFGKLQKGKRRVGRYFFFFFEEEKGFWRDGMHFRSFISRGGCQVKRQELTKNSFAHATALYLQTEKF